MDKKVFVGLSGGVDSSVTAAMLMDKGYNVSGINLVLTENDEKVTSKEAEKIAKVLDIPFYKIDLREDFDKYVISYFVEEYKKGRTPNPCIVCNQFIKFGAMLDRALELGADCVATGHYAQVEQQGGEYILRASSSAKDQSYFLYRLNQRQLEHVMFPVAGFEKLDTRALAEQYHLPVADKKDSQEICFVPDNDYAGFIHRYSDYEDKSGNFVDLDGNILGEHRGIIHYTVGQRKGLGMAFGQPMFVTKIDAKTNEVVLAPDGFQQTREFLVENLSFISGRPLCDETHAKVKIRFRAQPSSATLIPKEDKILVVFDEPQRAVTPGQSAVFYDNDIVIGGGFIL